MRLGPLGRLGFGALLALWVGLAGPAPARAVEAWEGRIQIHGAVSEELRIVADGYRIRKHNWFMSKMATKLSVEVEVELLPDGFGPFDIVEGFARVDVQYDCIWEHACHMAPQWNYFGDDARRWPANLANGKTRGVTGVRPDPLGGVEDEQPDRRLVKLTEIDPFSTLLSLGSEEDVQTVFGTALEAKFSTKYAKGSLSSITMQLGPVNPEFEIDSTGALVGVAPGIQEDLPFRPTDRPLAGTLFVPSPALRRRINDYDNPDVNFTENELAWNRGASQQQTKELKEAYLDITMFDGKFVMRLGKQITRWGKTELFRSGTPDQLNPQDFAISNLPSFEESLIALWQARFVTSFYNVGPFEDVRLEAVLNLDHFEPSDLGDCGEPYTVFLVCQKQAGLLAHGISGLGIAGERRPGKFYEDPVDNLEFGLRLEFRYGRFSLSVTDTYGYDDFPTPDWFYFYERNVDPRTGRPRRAGATGPCTTGDSTIEPACLDENNAGVWHSGNRQLYDTVCAATANLPIDPAIPISIDDCVISVFNEQQEQNPPAVGFTLPRILSDAMGGGDFFNLGEFQYCTVFCGTLGRIPLTPDNMTVPLHPGFGDRARNPAFGQVSKFGLRGFLSPEQQALMGCGALVGGSNCNVAGIDLFNLEASVAFQAFTQTEHAGQPLNGAIGTRFVPGVGLVQIPGVRSVFNYFADPVGFRWNPSVDGCVIGLGALPDGQMIFDDLVARGLTENEASQCDWDPNPAVDGPDAGYVDNGLIQGGGYFVPVPDLEIPGLGAQYHFFDQTDGADNVFTVGVDTFTLAEIRARFPNEMAIVSENLARILVGVSQLLDGADPRCDYDLESRLFCEFYNALFESTAVQRPERRAGGNGNYGRRDMSWLSGGELELFYERRNVLGVSVDFAEDRTQTTWGIDATWIEDAPYGNNRAERGFSREDTLNLTMSIDRPTFINFLNANRTVFFNSQVFIRYIPNYERRDTFDVDGPFSMLGTLTAFTGFWQDRLMTFVTLVHELESNSGGQIVTMNYRFSESFSATVGVSSFYGSPSRQRVLQGSPVTRFHCCDFTQRTNYRGVSAITERDELFFTIRKTF